MIQLAADAAAAAGAPFARSLMLPRRQHRSHLMPPLQCERIIQMVFYFVDFILFSILPIRRSKTKMYVYRMCLLCLLCCMYIVCRSSVFVSIFIIKYRRIVLLVIFRLCIIVLFVY